MRTNDVKPFRAARDPKMNSSLVSASGFPQGAADRCYDGAMEDWVIMDGLPISII